MRKSRSQHDRYPSLPSYLRYTYKRSEVVPPRILMQFAPPQNSPSVLPNLVPHTENAPTTSQHDPFSKAKGPLKGLGCVPCVTCAGTPTGASRVMWFWFWFWTLEG